MVGKIYLEKDVLTAANERLTWILTHFEAVYLAVSGGKDSSVMVQLADRVASRLGRKFDALYIDMEAQYAHTIAHIEDLKTLPSIDRFYHVALPMALRNAVSTLQPKWICWDEDERDLWVRDMPDDAICAANCPWEWFHKGMEFEEFVKEFALWYHREKGVPIACGIAIRADESLNRFSTIAFAGRKTELCGLHWTTRIDEGVYNFYPIYDWRCEDMWGAVSQLNLKANEIYELMYKNGLSIYQQRLCQPYGDDQRNGLDQFRALEPETWNRVLNRVNGVNFGNIYCRTSALGNLRTSKPDFMSWEEYTVFLLESIGLYNRDLMLHYYHKIKKFIRWYEKTDGLDPRNIPDEADSRLESRRKAISWRRVARALEKNDFYMKRLSFAQTKSDEAKLRAFVGRWKNFLTREEAQSDKDLMRFLDRYELMEREEAHEHRAHEPQ
ncbi:MAG TPA: DUF3440 domain-containing protein [Candidatus Alectryocaccomicrobium excrementavium]|uniref:DUF3440 domain-containing protein n=1 Tax=Candidatus Alectryocaccomicrobium excrementavium TaxID=2840668 RepID=A0A9D1K5A2_9FIRM|nr:DUF3440 domain-containing protein [Candidatus Alectryocaccomicrobium excrementavium]